MKRVIIAVMAAAALTACTKTQSSLSLDDITTYAVVKGQVSRETTTIVNGEIVTGQIPVPRAKVVAEISCGAYTGSNSSSTITVEGVADAEGKYSVKIPVGQNSVSVSLHAASFEGEYGMVMGSGVVTTNAIFNGNSTSLYVSRGEIYARDLTMDAANIEMDGVRQRDLHVKGVIQRRCERRNSSVTADANNAVEVATETVATDFFLVLSNSNHGMTYMQKCTCQASGEYEADLKVFELWTPSETRIQVKTIEYLGTFRHYYYSKIAGQAGWKSIEVPGVYNGAYSSSMSLSTSDFNYGKNLGTIVVSFSVADRNTIPGIGIRAVDYDQDNNQIYSNHNWMGW